MLSACQHQFYWPLGWLWSAIRLVLSHRPGNPAHPELSTITGFIMSWDPTNYCQEWSTYSHKHKLQLFRSYRVLWWSVTEICVTCSVRQDTGIWLHFYSTDHVVSAPWFLFCLFFNDQKSAQTLLFWNWLDSLCCSSVWLPVWLDLLCAARLLL